MAVVYFAARIRAITAAVSINNTGHLFLSLPKIMEANSNEAHTPSNTASNVVVSIPANRHTTIRAIYIAPNIVRVASEFRFITNTYNESQGSDAFYHATKLTNSL